MEKDNILEQSIEKFKKNSLKPNNGNERRMTRDELNSRILVPFQIGQKEWQMCHTQLEGKYAPFAILARFDADKKGNSYLANKIELTIYSFAENETDAVKAISIDYACKQIDNEGKACNFHIFCVKYDKREKEDNNAVDISKKIEVVFNHNDVMDFHVEGNFPTQKYLGDQLCKNLVLTMP